MRIPIYQVDAFASRLFEGNPAAVCPLESWLPDDILVAIAAENNLSETAFLAGGDGRYALRWFTPTTEVDLCGHATLAAAYVVFRFLEPGLDAVRFDTRSGELTVRRRDQWLEMDFPSRAPARAEPPPGLVEALGRSPREVWKARDFMAVYDCEDEVRELAPDLVALSRVEMFAVIVTAPGSDSDFVSRFFAPAAGVPEDPVTGSAHCTLAPAWASRLGKSVLRARQLSRRGGEILCEVRGDRVALRGQAVLYLEGHIWV
ncbi:MAG: PhzF family phenazine biosynthesis protein [Bryobacteraceae bacterium]|nr:PhzF family phenazine biosynthesis protein [Bryobacteraceae bacterium]